MVQKRLEGTCGYTPSPRLQHFCTANNSHSQMNDTYPIESACYVARILTRKKISYNLSLLDLDLDVKKHFFDLLRSQAIMKLMKYLLRSN